jgi:hypothetical protein
MLVAFVVLALLAGLTAAQGPEPPAQTADPEGEDNTAAAMADTLASAQPMAVAGDLGEGFYYQGILTEDSRRVTGSRLMEFRLFDAASGGSQVGSTLSGAVTVANGQFSAALGWGRAEMNGRALWLEVRVRDSGGVLRNLGRQRILAVPYAMSLIPGAEIVATSSSASRVLLLSHTSTSGGVGLEVRSQSGTAIQATGDVKQDLSSDGLVKAAVFANCAGSGSVIRRSFNNMGITAFSISSGPGDGRCTINFGVNVSSRYITASPHTSGGTVLDRGVTVRNADSAQVEFFRFDTTTGEGSNGDIAVIVY